MRIPRQAHRAHRRSRDARDGRSHRSVRNPRVAGTGEPITIGFSVPAVDDYYGVVRDSFVAAAEAQGVSYFEGNGDGAADPTQQIAEDRDDARAGHRRPRGGASG